MGKIFLRGLIGLAPIAITIALLFWIYNQLETTFGDAFKDIMGPTYYFKGLGVITAIVILFLAGLTLNNWIAQSFLKWFEKILKKIPLLNTIYSSVNDLMSFFGSSQKQQSGKVVSVRIGNLKMIGIISREDFDDLPLGIGTSDEVAVFFPFSYQIGGFTTIVSKSHITSIDMPLEKGLRFCMTAASPSDSKQDI